MAAGFSSLVALRAKQGEFEALDAWDRKEQIHLVQPLLELDPPTGLQIHLTAAFSRSFFVPLRKSHTSTPKSRQMPTCMAAIM